MKDKDEQTHVALQCALESVFVMLARGVIQPHIPPAALVMVGLGLLEASASRAQIAEWLIDVAKLYKNS
jgi:hypothetical protein